MKLKWSSIMFGGVAGMFLILSLNNVILPLINPQMSKAGTDKKIQEIQNYIDAYYVESYEDEDLQEGMFLGYVYGLGDRYSSYMDKSTFDTFMEQTRGVYAGIGAAVSETPDGRVLIVTPYDGSPAAQSGILAGDKIMKVNGLDITGAGLDAVVSMMKGPEGTEVNLTIYRETEGTTFDVDVYRAKITIPTVSHEMMDGNIGFIRISSFEGVTYDQFVSALTELKSSGMEALIIDLRNNPGGLLDVVSQICDELVPEGVIVYTEDKNGNKDYKYSDSEYLDLPMVLLVNNNSASASEVMAGAIKDYKVGDLIGEQTFGKGVVQNLFPLKDGSAIKLTTARYYSPNGICIHGEGIAPDYVVAMDKSLGNKVSSLSYQEDAQLQKAVEVLEEKTSAKLKTAG